MRMTAGITMDQPEARECPALLTLDWASLGRVVQAHALQAMAMHFAAVGEASSGGDIECGDLRYPPEAEFSQYRNGEELS